MNLRSADLTRAVYNNYYFFYINNIIHETNCKFHYIIYIFIVIISYFLYGRCTHATDSLTFLYYRTVFFFQPGHTLSYNILLYIRFSVIHNFDKYYLWVYIHTHNNIILYTLYGVRQSGLNNR